jgi:dTDP-4-amino-4,6-dideoxygalactose transaminase
MNVLRRLLRLKSANCPEVIPSATGKAHATMDSRSSLDKVDSTSSTEQIFKNEDRSASTTFVTRPFLPPLAELLPYLQDIWDTRVLTNGGKFHQLLEDELCKYLGVKYISLFANGTLALVTALQALGIEGEVITTPFSFVATSHSLLWNGIKPVFIDVDPKSLNINPALIESAITEKTTAILAVHCFGHPCDVDAIQSIANKHGLKVIYDAAHAFGVDCHCGSVLAHGDLSALSFHATKVFNTFEGGAIICNDIDTKVRIDQLKNFGHQGETRVVSLGINGKMSEFNSALGLVQLKHIDAAIDKRKEIDNVYRIALSEISGIQCIGPAGEVKSNYSYFPILINSDYPLSRDDLYERMKADGIHARRYFYPLISDFPMYESLPSSNPTNLPCAKVAASQVLCLPIYPDLPIEKVEQIGRFISAQ